MASSNENSRNIIARVQKLISLAHGGTTEAEAAEAMKMVHALLAKHNLSYSDISEEPHNPNEDRLIDSECIDGMNDPWRRSVWHATSKLYFCEYYFSSVYGWRSGVQKKTGIRHNLVGKPHNILVTKLMVQYFVDTIRRLAREHTPEESNWNRNTFKNSFKVSCSRRLTERIGNRRFESKNQTAAKSGNTMLPALRTLYTTELEENQKQIRREGIKLVTKSNQCRVTNILGGEAGRKAADGIGLDSQVTHGSGATAVASKTNQLELPV